MTSSSNMQRTNRGSWPVLHSTSALTFFRSLFVYSVLIVGGIIITIPFIWMVSTSLKNPDQVFAWPIQWIPRPIRWANFSDALSARPFALYAMNTLIITICAVIGQVLSSSLVAYSFSRLNWPGRKTLFAIMMTTLMLPSSVTMIPRFVIFSKLGWVNTFLPLIVPEFMGNAFNIFLIRQFFRSLPKEIDEAAKIDGCGILGIYVRILVPLSKSVLMIVAINTFRFTWNDFMNPLIYLNDRTLWTLTLGLRAFQQQFTVQWNLLMAASLVVMLPVLVLFFVAQKYFIQGIVFTGIKG